MTSTGPNDLRQSLDTLAERSRRALSAWALRRDLRLAVIGSIVWLLAVPVVLFAAQAVLAATGRAPIAWPLWAWIALTIAGPIIFVAVRVATLAPARRQDRRTSLGAYDLQLDSRDRLVTADEFLSEPESPFKAAAIEDAAPIAARALDTSLDSRELPAWKVSAKSWAAIPAALALILAAMWLGRLAMTVRGEAGPGTSPVAVDLDTLPAKVVARLLDLRPQSRAPERRASDPAAPNDAPSSRDVSPPTTKSALGAEGQSYNGGQANSRSSSQSMSSTGTPSNQQTPSPPLDEEQPPEPQKPSTTLPKKPDSTKVPPQASSATSGQGMSKSSSNDKTAIPAADTPDRAGANKDDGPDQAGIQDEVEEEKTAGVERPSLRKNKPPVDRNLSPRPTGDQPNPNANGRSGPGGRKKTRGVPSMILGVPTPDRIQGLTNPGRSKVTQENSTPKEEPQSALTAEQRRARDAAFGHVDHPLLQPWMLNLVEQYFLQLRGKTPPPQPSAKGSR